MDVHWDEDEAGPAKRKKYEFSEPILDETDELPHRLRHVRMAKSANATTGIRSVCDEIFLVMSQLKTQFHMSEEQCMNAIVLVANNLFERKWKVYKRDKPMDIDTLPAPSNTRRVDKYLEAMTLSAIVEEIMDDGEASVMYANDGSGMSMAFFHLNGK